MTDPVYEPVQAFNFQMALPWEPDAGLSEYFGLTVESAYINLTQKNGRITLREFCDPPVRGGRGLELAQLYLQNAVKGFEANLLDPFGTIVRTYVFEGVELTSFGLSLGNQSFPVLPSLTTGEKLDPEEMCAKAPRQVATNDIYFKFSNVTVVPRAETVLPEGVKWLTLDYRSTEGMAEQGGLYAVTVRPGE